MGRLRVKRRQKQIKIKQNRQVKLAKLRLRYAEAKFDSEKKKILNKVGKISQISQKEFLASVKSAK